MTDIAISPLERTGLPPSRVGEVKPPLSLADRSGEIGLATATAKFAGDNFDKLVKTQAANEVATFEGGKNTEIENYNTFVKSNPGASWEELETELGKMFTRIEALGQQATTSQGKQEIKQWMLRNATLPDGTTITNKGLIFAQAKTAAMATRARQQTATSEEHIKGYMNKFDVDGLQDHYARMVESGLYDKEFTEARFENQKSVIAEAQKKVAVEQLTTAIESQVFQVAASQGYPAAEAMLRDPATTASLIESGVPRADIKSLLTDVSERLKHEKVVADEKLEIQRETDRGQIYDAIDAGEVKLPDGSTSTDIRSFIERSSLDEDEQEAMWQKSINETDRKLRGEDIITAPRVRSQLYKDIMGILTGAQTRDDILDRANNARFGDFSDPENPIEPTLSDADYKTLVAAVNAQYEQGYGQMMSRVNGYAEGILLQTDAFGFVAQGPVRHEVFGNFQEAWLQWVAGKGDTLKLSEIYPEGRRLAATFQISDDEAITRETAREDRLKLEEGFGEELEDALREDKPDPLDKDIAFGKKQLSTRIRMRRPPLRPGLDAVIFKVLEKDKARRLEEGWTVVEEPTKKLTPKIARRYLDLAGGDLDEAKRLAAEDGYKE